MTSDIDTIALEAAQDVAKISRSMPIGGNSQMVAQMQCRIINAIDEAKRAVVGSAEPVVTWQDRAKNAGDWPCFSGDMAAKYMAQEIADLRAISRFAPPSTDAKDS